MCVSDKIETSCKVSLLRSSLIEASVPEANALDLDVVNIDLEAAHRGSVITSSYTS